MDPYFFNPQYLDALEKAGPFRALACFQCRKCTNGCPLTFAMDLMPDEVIRLVVLGEGERVLRSRTLWVCSSCGTCSTRCPNEVRIAELMDHLKETALKEGVPCPEPEVLLLHQSFLKQIKKRGRVFETFLLPSYTLRSGLWRKSWKEGTWLRDLILGVKMAQKGRLSWRPHRTADRAGIERAFSERDKGPSQSKGPSL